MEELINILMESKSTEEFKQMLVENFKGTEEYYDDPIFDIDTDQIEQTAEKEVAALRSSIFNLSPETIDELISASLKLIKIVKEALVEAYGPMPERAANYFKRVASAYADQLAA